MPSYQHLIDGAIGDTPHHPGDPVDPAIPERKLEEWLAAGLIKPVSTPSKPKRIKKESDHDND